MTRQQPDDQDSKTAQEVRYVAVLLEEMRDQNRAVLEAVGDMQEKMSMLPTREEFNEVKDDIKIIKAAITDISNEQKVHNTRLDALESGA